MIVLGGFSESLSCFCELALSMPALPARPAPRPAAACTVARRFGAQLDVQPHVVYRRDVRQRHRFRRHQFVGQAGLLQPRPDPCACRSRGGRDPPSISRRAARAYGRRAARMAGGWHRPTARCRASARDSGRRACGGGARAGRWPPSRRAGRSPQRFDIVPGVCFTEVVPSPSAPDPLPAGGGTYIRRGPGQRWGGPHERSGGLLGPTKGDCNRCYEYGRCC